MQPSVLSYLNSNRQIIIILSASLLLLAGILIDNFAAPQPALIHYSIFLFPYVLVGHNVILSAIKNIGRGIIFDENFLMTISTIGAILINHLPEAVGVMLFYYIGEFFQDKAVDRSRRSIEELMDIKPDFANIKVNGELETVPPETVEPGSLLVVKPGEKIPIDGIVVEGTSFLDTSALTGESVPKKVEPGKEILAGMINTNGLITLKSTKTFEDSSVSKILELIEKSSQRKAPTEQFITKFSRYYTPVVVFSAAALAFIPPLILSGAVFSDWIYRALILLVIACPCALVVSIPMAYFAGIGSASRKGILIKGANYLEALTNLHSVVFDKTGTLSKGVFEVAQIATFNDFSEEKLLYYAAAVESYSLHPIATSIIKTYSEKYGNFTAKYKVKDYEEIPGRGVRAVFDGKEILVGNAKLLEMKNVPFDTDEIQPDLSSAAVYVAVNGTPAGFIEISDKLREDSLELIPKLKALGVKQTVLLTGDKKGCAEAAASRLNIEEYYAELLPQDKVSKVEELLADKNKGHLAYIGDGINDAPVITRADIGIAMGGLGSDAAIEAADIVIMEDRLSRLIEAVKTARSTRAIVIQNIILALGIKALFMTLGITGFATLWEAVFADVGVTLIAILNSMRLLNQVGS